VTLSERPDPADIFLYEHGEPEL